MVLTGAKSIADITEEMLVRAVREQGAYVAGE